MTAINQIRTIRILLTRFSKAANIMTTLPVVQYKVDSVNITIGYISNVPLTVNLVNVLSDYISKVFGVKVIIRLVRIDNYYSDAHILAQYLSSLIGGSAQSSHTFKVAMQRLSRYIAFSVYNPNSAIGFKGLRVQISGRLATEPTRPRQTVHVYSIGSFKSNRLQASSYTSTNTKGSMTIKVWLGL